MKNNADSEEKRTMKKHVYNLRSRKNKERNEAVQRKQGGTVVAVKKGARRKNTNKNEPTMNNKKRRRKRKKIRDKIVPTRLANDGNDEVIWSPSGHMQQLINDQDLNEAFADQRRNATMEEELTCVGGVLNELYIKK